MSFDEIRYEILKESQKITDEVVQNVEDYEIISNFSDKNISKLRDIDNDNIEDLVSIYIKKFFPELSFKDIIKEVSLYDEILCDLDFKRIDNIIKCLEKIIDSDKYTELLDIVGENNPVIRVRKINKICENYSSEEAKKQVKELIKPINILGMLGINTKKLIEITKENKDVMLSLFNYISLFKVYRELELENKFDKCSEKEKDKIISEEIRKDKLLFKYNALSEVNSYCADYIKQDEKDRKKVHKQIIIYDNVISILNKRMDKDEIINIDIFKKIPNEEIRMHVLKLVLEHNMKYQNKVLEEYNNIKNNSILSYKSMLHNYGIEPNEYYAELIKKNSLEDVESIIKLLNKVQITDNSLIVSILETSNIEIVKFITDLAKKEILDVRQLDNKINIFNQNSDDFKNLQVNLRNIISRKINPSNFYNSSKILVIEPEILSTTLRKLDEYNLLTNITNKDNLYFLNNKNIEKKIDMIIELGYEKYLEKDLNLLNYSDERLLRLKLLKELNYEIEDKDVFYKMLDCKTFIVPDNKINRYLADDSKKVILRPEEDSEIDDDLFIESYLKKIDLNKNKRVYDLSGIKLSKNRVKRNLKELESKNIKGEDKLLYAFVKDSILTGDEIEKINGKLIEKLTR